MRKRVIAVFTGNRAEYGLQYPILRAVSMHSELDYRLLVSGAHLDSNFGGTLDEIKADGFRVDAEIRIDMDDDALFSTAKAIGSGIIEVSKVLEEIKPDIMVVYADRFEGLAAVVASSQMGIPTAHIEGGDLTEGGALDDSVRHAMTKLSHLHFTTNEQASNRLLAMGEEKWRVHTVGFPAIDLIEEDNYASECEVAERFNLNLEMPVVLFTQHSVSTEFDQASEQVTPSLKAMISLAENDVQVILTYPNNDAGGRAIISELESIVDPAMQNIQLHRSLGRYFYHGVLALARNAKNKVACVGNSSSGIKETPAFFCPTVNIGSRQLGRLRSDNVLDAEYNFDEIIEKTRKCLFDGEFRSTCTKAKNPYFQGGAGKKVADILAQVLLDQNLIRKGMTIEGRFKEGWFR